MPTNEPLSRQNTPPASLPSNVLSNLQKSYPSAMIRMPPPPASIGPAPTPAPRPLRRK
jgi:hypothetical protein